MYVIEVKHEDGFCMVGAHGDPYQYCVAVATTEMEALQQVRQELIDVATGALVAVKDIDTMIGNIDED